MKIVIWNANGLAQRTIELESFLIQHNIDVMLISETHFTEKHYIKVHNYQIYKTNHPDGKAHGGTAIIIKNKIKHHEIEKYNEEYLQATNVVVEDLKGPLTISAIYCPPEHTIKENMFNHFFEKLGHRYIAGGDYNAKHPWWGSRLPTPNPRGRQLYAAIQKNNLSTISTGEPTYWPADKLKMPDLIDFAITKGLSLDQLTAVSCLDLSSDHSPVVITLKTQILSTQKQMYVCNKKTNWVKYRDFINDNLSCNTPLKTVDELENAIEKFNVLIHQAAAEATPLNGDSKAERHLPKHISIKICEKRKLRRIWQHTRSPTDKTKLNKATRELTSLLYQNKNDHVQNYLERLTPTEATDYSLWKATKYLKRPQKFITPMRQ